MAFNFQPRNVQIVDTPLRQIRAPKIDTPLDFRVKRATAEKHEALAEKYSLENLAAVKKQQLQEIRGRDLQASIGADGKPDFKVLLGLAAGRQDMDMVTQVMGFMDKQEELKQKQQESNIKAMDAVRKSNRTFAIMGYNNPTLDMVERVAEHNEGMIDTGNPYFEFAAKNAREFLKDPNNNNPEKIKHFFGADLDPKDLETTTVDLGGKVISKSPYEDVNEERTMTPGQKRKSEDYRARTKVMKNKGGAGGKSAADRRAEMKSGVTWSEDGKSLVAIPGGKVDIQNKKNKAAALAAEEERLSLTNKVIEKNKFLADALDSIKDRSSDWSTTGWAGAVMQWLPQTKAWDQAEAIKTVEAHVSFAGLDDMRKASKTGGALGSIAVRELELLGALKGSLSIPQKKETFVKNVTKMLDHFTRVNNHLLGIAGRFDEIKVANKKPLTEEEYRRLPYGTWYMKPNGSKAVKAYPKRSKGLK